MPKPAGYRVFDRDHSMLAGGKFHSGSTLSNYGDATFEWETRAASKAGYMTNGVWDTDKGVVANNGQDRRYGVLDTPADYYTTPGAILYVYEHNGSLVNNGIINQNDSPLNTVAWLIVEKNNSTQMNIFNGDVFVSTTAALGVENALCIRMATPPSQNAGQMVWRIYSDVGGYNVPPNRTITSSTAWIDITDHYFLHDPAFMHLVPNITLNMVCYIEGDFTHNEALAWINDPWQITKEGIIVPPSAENPIMLGANF